MKKETLQNILYSPLYVWFKLHAMLPLPILYGLSDILFFPLYHIVHYRRKLVQENLRNAFPDKDKKELKQLEKKFYHHFCDYIVETIKLMHISDEEMRRRMVFEQVEIIDRVFAQNRYHYSAGTFRQLGMGSLHHLVDTHHRCHFRPNIPASQ